MFYLVLYLYHCTEQPLVYVYNNHTNHTDPKLSGSVLGAVLGLA